VGGKVGGCPNGTGGMEAVEAEYRASPVSFSPHVHRTARAAQGQRHGKVTSFATVDFVRLRWERQNAPLSGTRRRLACLFLLPHSRRPPLPSHPPFPLPTVREVTAHRRGSTRRFARRPPPALPPLPRSETTPPSPNDRCSLTIARSARRARPGTCKQVPVRPSPPSRPTSTSVEPTWPSQRGRARPLGAGQGRPKR
jgi:hypothetical protein